MNLKCDFCFNTASYPVTLGCCLFTTCYEHFDKWIQCGICETRVDHQQTLSKLKNKISHNLDQFKRQHDAFRILLGENKLLKHDPGYFISKNKISNPMLQNWLFSEMDSVQLDPIETKTNEFIFDTLTLSQTISDKLQLAEMIQRRLEILTDINKNFKLETKLLQNIEELKAKPKPTLAQSRKTDVPMASLRLTVNKFALRAKRSKDLVACNPNGRIDLVNSDLSTFVKKCKFKSSILCCFLFDNDTLACGCSDGCIHFCDLRLNKVISIVKAHKVDCSGILLIKDSILVSASTTGEIISWNLKSQKRDVHPSLMLNFQGHSRAVNGMEKFGKSSFLSCSDDMTICFWKVDCFSAKQIMMGHEAKVTCLKKSENNFFSGSYDGTVRMWSMANADFFVAKKIFWPDDKVSPVLCIDTVLDKFLVLAMANGKIKCWDVASKNLMVSIDAHNEAITCIDVTKNNCVVTSSSDGFVKLWKLNINDSN